MVSCAANTASSLSTTPTPRTLALPEIVTRKIFDAYDTETAALEDIDPRAIPIDCPALVWIQHDRKRIEREREAERATELAKKAQREEDLRLRGLSIDA